MGYTDGATEISLSDAARAAPYDAWTWFTDERAIVDAGAGAGGPRVLVGSVTAGAESVAGDIRVLWYDVGSGETGSSVLHEGLEQDDHDGPALFVRPDGRYLAMYSKHGNDSYTRWRVSTEPHDPRNWDDERTLDNGTGTTYCNVYRLPGDADGRGRTYCFTRTVNWDPNVLVSTDAGSTWAYGGRLLRQDEDDRRPYVRYASDGKRVHFVATDEHPAKFNNSIYHGYFEDGSTFDSSGRLLDPDVFGEDTTAPEPGELTTVFEADTIVAADSNDDGTRMTHGWTVDVTVDETDHPVALFQARADGDPSDHRFFYARYDGTGWHAEHVARAGPPLYDGQDDYTGLAAIDPDAPSSIVVSTPIDPRDDSALDYYELFAGSTTDGGASWDWTPLVPEASSDNVRPLIPAWNAETAALVWMQGSYATYIDWETRALLRTLERTDSR